MAALVPPTLGALLDRADLSLRAVVGEERGQRLRWIHSSDLLNPTPFLDDGVALLTTGTQFSRRADASAFDTYVRRLTEHGVAAIGFGTDVARARVPDGLVEACRAERMPLFEVPFGTPFIAVIRANAEAIAAEGYARRSWALAAQRAISLAALRPDPLGAVIAELARQLGGWAGLFDATGALAHARPARLPQAVSAALHEQTGAMLSRAVRAADLLDVEGRTFSLQTLGRGGELRGVLAVEAAALDQEARGVVTSVVAMAGFALEQNESLTLARGALRAGVVRALLAGEVALARSVAQPAWGGLPEEPALVGVTSPAPASLASFLELRAAQLSGRLFFGELPGGEGMLLIVDGRAAGTLDEVSARGGVRIGVSHPADYARLAASVDEARVARAAGRDGVGAIGEVSGALMSAVGEETRAAARTLLEPLARHDRAHGTDLIGTLRAWLDADTRYEDAARTLGVHRHTLRARLADAERVLGHDLSSFGARAELWLALGSTR
ncbi:PucR family transcriptional regulator [Microbacterium marinilacus]|uniref:PucR family transcriptional regulator n=1 Tax=Microbacterium marinilacus TaxID=415209 RepID=A0ABP7BBX3_9MICO|nr:PucR family transcriptional regulator [Microbacterium marinilacus]